MDAKPKEVDVATVLATLHRGDLLATLRRAECEANEAARVRDEIALWTARLAPYLEADETMTVSQALAHFRRDRDAMER